MRRIKTQTQFKRSCNIKSQQEQDFDRWFEQQKFANVCNVSEYAVWDTVGCQQRLWDRYQKGSAPWDLVMYFNNTEIVELSDVCDRIDQLCDALVPHGQIYLALNKWCVWVQDLDVSLGHLDFDQALPVYIGARLKRCQIKNYQYSPNERGGVGNWLHGNNRFWLVRNE